jgi:flagellar biosynthesis protein FliP
MPRFCGTSPVLLVLALLASTSYLFLAEPTAQAAGVALPNIQIGMQNANSPEQVAQGVQILLLLTVLTLAPSILVMTTSFTRMVIVLSLVRQAIGTPTLPPSQIIVSLALIMSFFVMTPTFDQINVQAFQPFMKGSMPVEVALEKTMEPLRLFMFKQTNEKDIALFTKLAKRPKPKTTADVPTHVLLPAFIISELKTAFQLGFVLFLPFIVIDIVVSSILVSMGMMFLPPVTISLPFKLILFVLVDGWHLIAESLILGFR